jgi:hypothetical protein
VAAPDLAGGADQREEFGALSDFEHLVDLVRQAEGPHVRRCRKNTQSMCLRGPEVVVLHEIAEHLGDGFVLELIHEVPEHRAVLGRLRGDGCGRQVDGHHMCVTQLGELAQFVVAGDIQMPHVRGCLSSGALGSA